MPDVFLYQSGANLYTIGLSNPTQPQSGSSVDVSATGNAAALFLGIVSTNTGINVSPSGNIISSVVGSMLVIASKPKTNVGRSSAGVDRKRKRRLGEMFSL
jgi:hypothetical protein